TPLHRALGRLVGAVATGTLTNCQAARRALLAAEPSARAVAVLENGVDLDRFLDVPPVQLPGGPGRVGAVANLRPVKGLDVLVEAAARLAGGCPRATFAVAGEGEERANLERLAAVRGLGERFRLCGAIGDIPEFLSGLHVAVLPSHSEGMSNAVLEYMAAGRPVVATAVGA